MFFCTLIHDVTDRILFHDKSDRTMRKGNWWIVIALLSISGVMLESCSPQKTETCAAEDSSQFVTLTDVVPDAILEIRYFGTYNFVGTRIDGYEAPTALLTREAADSLRAVSDDVMRQGYRLKIYDAYRPQKGVDHFVRWASNIWGHADETLLLSRSGQERALRTGIYLCAQWSQPRFHGGSDLV